MRIFMIGDIFGNSGVAYVRSHLKSIRKLKEIDFCIANGENAANGKGISKSNANELLACGVDVITMGNHTFNKSDIFSLFDNDYNIVRPINMPPSTPGSGYIISDVGDISVAVINACGRIYLESIDCPFRVVNSLVEKIKDKVNIIILDFHAEATSEKLAMAYYLNGKISAVLGTHTHIQTADERILSGGTAYITDVGMTGPTDSILGVKKEIIIEKFLTSMPQRFDPADGPVSLNGVIIDIDENTGKATKIERIVME